MYNRATQLDSVERINTLKIEHLDRLRILYTVREGILEEKKSLLWLIYMEHERKCFFTELYGGGGVKGGNHRECIEKNCTARKR